MERPWGLSGPEFLELYWIALAASVAFAIFVRVRLRGTRGGAPAGVLGLYDMAYLIGGPRRVVETSVASLIASGALRPSRNGAVQLVGSAVSDDPVDQVVLTDAGRYRQRTVSLLVNSLAEHQVPREVGRRLSEMDYVYSPEALKSKLRLGIAPMAVLLAVGVVRWVNGLLISAPVGWLTLQLVLTGVLIALLLKAKQMRRTARGNAAVASARAGEATGGWGATGSEAEVVALHGFAGHPNPELRTAMNPPWPSRPASRRTSRSVSGVGGASYPAVHTCSGGGDSSGGSSCGGGGGGGCGGGGGS